MSLFGGSSGSSAGDEGIVPGGPAPAKHHPFIDFGSIGSVLSAPVRGPLAGMEAFGKATVAAGKGLPGLLASAGKEAYGDVGEFLLDAPHDISLGAIPRPHGLLRALALEKNVPGTPYGEGHPFTQALGDSTVRAAQDVEQVARAGGNTLTPGQPFGSNVGQLGSGPGLLGNTELAHAAAPGGGGVLPKLLEDAATAAILTGPASALIGKAAEGAAAEAASASEALSTAEKAASTARKAAETSVKEATKRVGEAQKELYAVQQAAAAGDPAAAAAFTVKAQAVQAARDALSQAQDAVQQVAAQEAPAVSAAQEAADAAAQRAETLKGHADTAKLVHDLGQKGANSPFAAAGFAGRGILERAVGPAAHALVGTDLGQAFVQPVLDRAGAYAADLRQRAEETHATRSAIEEGRQKAANEGDTLRRGFEETARPTDVATAPKRSLLHPLGGGRPGREANFDAQAVTTMAHTGENAQLRQLMVGPLGAANPELVPEIFARATMRADGTPQYTPEQIELAMEVYGPQANVSARAAELRRAIPQAREAYAAGPEAIQAENYARLRGETQPIMTARTPLPEGAWAQVEHNLAGTGADIEHLTQWHDAVAIYEKRRGRFEKGRELAGRNLRRSATRLEGLNLAPEELQNPRLLVARVMGPATSVAREAVTGDLTALTAEGVEPRIRRIAQRVVDGKMNPDTATRDLASEILKMTVKDPDALSAPVRDLIDRAAELGIGDVPRNMPDIARAARPVEALGVARERLRAGTAEYDRAVRTIASADVLGERAASKLLEPNRPPSAGQLGAARRLVAATGQLRDLATKADEAATQAGAALPEDIAAVTKRDARQLVGHMRQAVKDLYRADAKDRLDELHRMDIATVNPTPPMKRQWHWSKELGRRVQGPPTPDWSDPAWIAGGGEILKNASKELGAEVRDTRFFRPDGKTPEEIVGNYHASRGVGGAGGHASGTEWDMEDWLYEVRAIRSLEDAGRRGVEQGWDPRSYGDAQGHIRDALVANGYEPELAGRMAASIAHGPASAAADALIPHLREEQAAAVAERAPDARLAEGGDVAAALEADRQAEVEGGATTRAGRASLDAQGKALYDREVAQAKVGVQGQIVAQREGQLTRAVSPGRAQGQREGALLGKAGERLAQGEAGATRGDAAVRSARPVLGQAPELTQETAARIAGPIGRLYSKAGSAERSLLDATREYSMQTRALERLDQGLLETHQKLMASIDAQPRPMRPVLEAGRRINAELLPMADEADTTIGAGAGDVYRSAAADALMTADQLRSAGIDPQFVIGMKERPVASSLNPDVARAHGVGEQLPHAAKTGQRIAGRGLAHPASYAEMHKAAGARLEQIIKNETAQRILDTVGGTLADKLEAAGMARDQIEAMSRGELIAAMRDAHLSAWDFSDRLGRPVPNARITLDTPVVPSHVWRAYSPYANEVFSGGKLLKAYDAVTQKWKAAVLVLTGRWHVNEILGNAMMGMVGSGTLPHDYWRNLQIASRLERLRTSVGTAEDRAFVMKHATPGQRAALEVTGGHTPGAVTDQGYFRSEFGAGTGRALEPGFAQNRLGLPNVHPIQAGWRIQSHLDNVNRTAVWLSELDKGLDARGLADFRKAYPDLAHLSDTKIQNEAAIRLSIRTIGDYKDLSAVEQAYVKRIIPFYPWLRHITKLTLNLAVHDPIRVAWMLHLGLMFSPETTDVDWLQNSYDMGKNRWLTPPNWNPFDSVARAFDPSNPFGAFNPLLASAAAGAGVDIKGMREITRAPGTGDTGGLTPLIGRPGEYAYYLSGQLPQGRAFREAIPALLGGKPIARYQTGQPVISRGAPISTQDQQIPFTSRQLPAAVGPLVPLLGLGYQRDVDAQQIAAAQAKRDAAARKAAASYERRRAAASAG